MKRIALLLFSMVVAVILIASSTLATTTETENMFEVVGKDIVGVSIPLRVLGDNTIQEFDAGTTWGRVIRIEQINNRRFFDLGIDKDGNFFINTPSDSATRHSLTISPSGEVTIPKLTQ